ncbi:MAG: uracil-DNA glycosylase [Alphaproteobacteria bacterium]|nr:uracil-DNA glycosylase [Alphaproteobacteria bacterium]
MDSEIKKLNDKIISCKKCLRLKNFREKIAKEKRKQFENEKYWGKPITGFGDIDSEILMLGLAPAAHGGNRTGRVFTGDKSADFLFKCLHKAKFANQSNSTNITDGLVLKNVYLTVALKCVPPFDKPTACELKECFKYLKQEIILLKNIKIIVSLGQIAFQSCLKIFDLKRKDFKFYHGARYRINKDLEIVASYHPSPRNVNTKRINQNKMVALLNSLK